MPNYTIYHNPRCSKSRASLQILQDNGIEPTIRLYLEDAPDAAELTSVLAALGKAPRDLLRKGEAAYAEAGLDDQGLDDAAVIAAMVEHPILIERPVVVCGDRAVVGRPPENVQDLIDA